MIKRIDHISIAVRDDAPARHFFETLLGAIPGAGARDDAMGYGWQIYSLGDLSRLELLKPTGPRSFLEGFLKQREGGVHHITLQTTDIQATRAMLAENQIPWFGYHEYEDGSWKELFIHPKDAFGVLIQIAEFHADDFLAPAVQLAGDDPWRVTPTANGCRLTLRHPGGGTAEVELDRQKAAGLAKALSAAAAAGA